MRRGGRAIKILSECSCCKAWASGLDQVASPGLRSGREPHTPREPSSRPWLQAPRIRSSVEAASRKPRLSRGPCARVANAALSFACPRARYGSIFRGHIRPAYINSTFKRVLNRRHARRGCSMRQCLGKIGNRSKRPPTDSKHGSTSGRW